MQGSRDDRVREEETATTKVPDSKADCPVTKASEVCFVWLEASQSAAGKTKYIFRIQHILYMNRQYFGAI